MAAKIKGAISLTECYYREIEREKEREGERGEARVQVEVSVGPLGLARDVTRWPGIIPPVSG